MKKLMFAVAMAAAGIGLGGCAMVGGPSATSAVGLFGIIDDNCSPASFRIDNNVKAAKCGEATSKSIVLYTTGDSSIKAAMDAGGITKIHHIDYRVSNFFNLFSKATTIVWGE